MSNSDIVFDHGDNPCPCCGAARWTPGLRLPPWPEIGAGGQRRLVECAQCGTAHLPPARIPAHADLPPITGDPRDAVTHRQKAAWAVDSLVRTFREQLGRRELKALVIGCSTGFEIDALLASPLTFAQVDGIDPNVNAVRIARQAFAGRRNVTIHEGYVESLKSGSYDVVLATMVWEHIRDPFTALMHVSRLQSAGGVLELQVPRYDNRIPRWLRGRLWFGLMPAHFWYYTADGMTAMLRRCGYADPAVHNVPRIATLGFALAKMAAAARRLAGKAAFLVPSPALFQRLPGRRCWKIGILRDAMSITGRRA